MLQDQTTRAIVWDTLRELGEQFEGVIRAPDQGRVRQEILKALDELRHRVATDSNWVDDLIISVREAQGPVVPAALSGSRQFGRKRVTVPVDVRADGVEDPALSVRDLGGGGMGIVSRQSFPMVIAQFYFTLPNGQIFSVEAESVHSQLEQVEPEIQFLSGWRFTARNAPAVVQALISAVTTPTEALEPQPALLP
jgi:hypothetical protein